ncbi:hypothetical protein GCM10010435_05030 [Winogradskya consettensis]|uniref:Amidoligase enzyme n=1 Tax=Winogradskya consettensis TaxID=113560 RepID=A0A919SY86_9ACTN|nr:amidoligase family protein [Actinoplanes consettensis]GIM79596.1 hypothetical protein Aco04nite_66340 [Actinoplanes consettensis]
MIPPLHRRIGFEIELMAPPGVSRRTLATDLAARHGGQALPVWHHDSELSMVPGLARFLHVTQGFEVTRADGSPLCTLVDDITLVNGLDNSAPAKDGWFRILGDEARLIRLVAAHSDPGGTLDTALDNAAKIWNRPVDLVDGVYRLDDEAGASIAMAAPLTGERERPCEIITPPLTADHAVTLEDLLGPARELGFTIPQEAAVHMHLDGAPFHNPATLANVIRLFAFYREPLRTALQTNTNSRRLAPLPPPLVRAVSFGTPSWKDLRYAATDGELTKFFDVNMVQLFRENPIRDTLEIRILPGALHTEDIINRAALIELLLDRCEDPSPIPEAPTDPAEALEALLELAAEALANRP